MTRIDAVVAGHICLDITPEFLSAGRTAAEFFRPGSLIKVGPATVFTGGTVSNTGFPLRRLGLRVQLMGKCGRDVLGQAILEAIRTEAPGAESGMRVVAGEQSSYSVVISPPGLDRMFLHCPGANDTFVAADIDLNIVSQARLFHFGYPPLMARTFAKGPLEGAAGMVEGAELVKIFQAVRQAGATTSLDLACPDPASPAGKANWAAILQKTLPLVDIFTPSVEELTFMLRRKTFDALVARAAGRELIDLVDGELLCELGEKCIELGAAIVLIKCGRQGIYVRTAGPGRLQQMGRARPESAGWANRELFEPSYFVEKVLAATGAGDCAIAGFLASVIRDCPLEAAMRHACALGAQNVTANDAVSGIRSWDETLAQVAARPARRDVTIALSRFRYDDAQQHYLGPRDGQA